MKTSKKLMAASLLVCALILPACAGAPAWEAASEPSDDAAHASVPELTLEELGLRQLPIEWDNDARASYSLLCMKSEAFLLIDGHRTSPPVVRAPVYDSYCER